MKTLRFGFAATWALLFALCASTVAQQPGTKPTPAAKQEPPPALHQMLQAMDFPLAVPVTEKPDPTRLYKQAIEIISRQHIALTGYIEPPVTLAGAIGSMFGQPAPAKKSKMQDFVDKWEKPPFELKTLEDADKAIQMALKSLDHRFDSYLLPIEVKAEDKDMDNKNLGIGVIVKLEGMKDLVKDLPKDSTEEQVDKALIVSDKNYIGFSPIKNGPAAKAGVLDGDILKEVDGKKVNGMTYAAAIKLLKGKKDSTVDIIVERKESGSAVQKKFTVKREEYEVPVVTLKHLGNDVWHLHLETFAVRNAAKDVKEALDEVMKKGGKKLIFDLRDNGGGLLDQAIDIAMFMIPEGTIVTQQHRLFGGSDVVETQHHVTTHVMLETRPQMTGSLPLTRQRVLAVPAEMPIVMLVNGNSASASELVTGAMKFNNRAKVVGVRTFGKGVGQALLDLVYGRRLHLTSFYFLPANKFTDWIGVETDVEVKFDKEAFKAGKDNQLEKAVEVVNQMYDDGVKARKEKVDRDAQIKEENRKIWERRMERRKQMEEEAKKKEAEKNKPKDAPKPEDAPKPKDEAQGSAKPQGTGDPQATGKQGDPTTNPSAGKPGDPAGATPGTTKPGTPTTPTNPTTPTKPVEVAPPPKPVTNPSPMPPPVMPPAKDKPDDDDTDIPDDDLQSQLQPTLP